MNATPREISPGVLISGQITAEAMPDLRRAGVSLVVNNRPEGEDPLQPSGPDIAAAAAEAGIDYVAVPIRGAPPAPAIDAVRAALNGRSGNVLMYCRSGMRSAAAWALAQSPDGRLEDGPMQAAADIGYDLSGLRP